MHIPITRSVCCLVCTIAAHSQSSLADEAASNYLYAVLELDSQVPIFVHTATTDDPKNGFANLLSDEQAAFLKRETIASALDRFDAATSGSECVWSRFSQANWSNADLNDRIHHLARVVLLRARKHYETGRWIEGNRDVERVRIMARHMVLQARPFEHQCFMVENMANFTAAAYLLRFPDDALDDLLERHRRVGLFSPKAGMLAAEADRLGILADDYEEGRVALGKVLSLVDPYLTQENTQFFTLSSRKEATAEIRSLSSFLKDHSRLVELEHDIAEQKITDNYRKHSKSSRIVAGWDVLPVDDYRPVYDYRENAQSVCRGNLMDAVITRVRSGAKDFANIPDPYSSSSKPFDFQKHGRGFTLTSELKNGGQIDIRFGLADAARSEN